MEPTIGVEPMNLFLTKEALYRLSYVGVTCSNKKKNGMAGQGKAALDIKWSGRRGSNSRHSAWKAEALPTELLPRSHSKHVDIDASQF